MPNIVAHNHLTYRYIPNVNPDMALGSVLPDFVGMYRDYHGGTVSAKNLSATMDMGIHIHHKSDQVFDKQPENSQITESLTAHLENTGIPPRAARLAGHFLADVMLDGALIDQPQPRADYDKLADDVLYERTLLHRGHFPAKFAELVSGYFEREIPVKYRDPEELARITLRRLDFRSQRNSTAASSSIPRNQIKAVSEVIDIQAEWVYRLGQAALERTIQILQAEPTYA